jgi:hypothetical protein
MESPDIEELPCGTVNLHGAGCQFSFLDQMEKKFPNLLRSPNRWGDLPKNSANFWMASKYRSMLKSV